MRKRRMLSLFGALALACAGLTAPGEAGKTVQDPVAVTFRDASGDAIRSDNQTPYADGQSDVSAFLGNLLNLHTDYSKQDPAGRTLWLDFGHGDADATAPPPSGYYPAYLWNNTYDVTGTTTLRAMLTADVRYFALWVRFSTLDGTSWEIRFDPRGAGNSPVKVTCLETLKRWRIETELNRDTARLWKVSPGQYVDHGHFHMPFSLEFTRLP